MAVFELQRRELHSEFEDQHIGYQLIHEQATHSYISYHCSPNVLIDQEMHLCLLAGAIQLHKYNGRLLYRQIHQDITDS